jgi:ankyrin repeat protein
MLANMRASTVRLSFNHVAEQPHYSVERALLPPLPSSYVPPLSLLPCSLVWTRVEQALKHTEAAAAYPTASVMRSFLGSLEDLPPEDRLLLVAAEQQDLATVQQQLAAEANVSAVDSRGQTALHAAALVYDEAVVSALLDAGANASASRACSDAGALTPLLSMIKSKGRDPWCRPPPDGPSEGVLHGHHECWARCEQINRVAQRLLGKGAKAQVADPLAYDLTPLHYAAEAGCPTQVKALLKAGADPGSTSRLGYTVLHAAVDSAIPEVVQRVLADLGPSKAPDMIHALGQQYPRYRASTPLYAAVAYGKQEVVEALTAAGADLERPDADGCPVLHWALTLHQGHLVPLLATHGSVQLLSQLYGNTRTPVHEAVRCGGVQRHPASSGAPHRLVHVPAPIEAVKAVLGKGVDILAKDQEGHTALYDAALRGHKDSLQLLLDHYPWHYLRQLYQQAGQQGKQLVLDHFEEAGAYALSTPLEKGSLWGVLVTAIADNLGGEAVRTLWAALKPRVCNLQQPLGSEAEHTGGRIEEGNRLASFRRVYVRLVWMRCWVSACAGLAAQPAEVIAHLEQQVSCWRQQAELLDEWRERQQRRQQQQQQQQCDAVGEGSTTMSTRPPPVAPPAARAADSGDATPATQPCGGSTSTPPSAGARSMAAVMEELEAAATSGSLQGVQAALEQLQDRAKGLSAAAAAAGGAGHWALFKQLLRELVMLDSAKGPGAGLRDSPQMHQALLDVLRAVEVKLQQRMGAGGAESQGQLQLQALVQVCDALLEDWLAVRQQRANELEKAVEETARAGVDVAAAQAAAKAVAAAAVAAKAAAATAAADMAGAGAAAEAAAAGATADGAAACKRRRM